MAGSASLGKLEIKFDKFDDIYDEIESCKELYQTRINHLQRVKYSLNSTSTSYFSSYIENEIENAIDDIDTQLFVYSQHVSGMDTIKETIKALEQEAEDTEERIAKHINTEMGDFCKTNDIEVDDPDEEKKWYEKVGDFFEDVGDGIKQFYEDFKYVFNFVLDVVITVVAVVCLAVAIGSIIVGTGGTGFVAVATIIAGVYGTYESVASAYASGKALQCHLDGDEEAAIRYTNIRNDGAGRHYFVTNVGKLVGKENASKIYCAIAIIGTVCSIYSIGHDVYNIAKNTPGNLKTKFMTGLKEIFKPKVRGKNINVGDAFDETMGIWQVLDAIKINPSVETLETLYNIKGYIEKGTGGAKVINTMINMGDLYDAFSAEMGAKEHITNMPGYELLGDLCDMVKIIDKTFTPEFE